MLTRTCGVRQGFVTRKASTVFSLKNKTALVTGAASGIGAAIAETLAAAGARVVIVDRDEANGEQIANRIRGSFLKLDVSSADECLQAAKRVGQVDILANIAGVGHVG